MIRLSQWFIMVCLWLYCISITKKSDMSITVIYHGHVSDCTIHVQKEKNIQPFIRDNSALESKITVWISMKIAETICIPIQNGPYFNFSDRVLQLSWLFKKISSLIYTIPLKKTVLVFLKSMYTPVMISKLKVKYWLLIPLTQYF